MWENITKVFKGMIVPVISTICNFDGKIALPPMAIGQLIFVAPASYQLLLIIGIHAPGKKWQISEDRGQMMH